MRLVSEFVRALAHFWKGSYTNVAHTRLPLITRYMADRPSQSESIYVEQLFAMRDYGRTTLYVDFRHILDYDEVLARAISEQY